MKAQHMVIADRKAMEVAGEQTTDLRKMDFSTDSDKRIDEAYWKIQKMYKKYFLDLLSKGWDPTSNENPPKTSLDMKAFHAKRNSILLECAKHIPLLWGKRRDDMIWRYSPQ